MVEISFDKNCKMITESLLSALLASFIMMIIALFYDFEGQDKQIFWGTFMIVFIFVFIKRIIYPYS